MRFINVLLAIYARFTDPKKTLHRIYRHLVDRPFVIWFCVARCGRGRAAIQLYNTKYEKLTIESNQKKSIVAFTLIVKSSITNKKYINPLIFMKVIHMCVMFQFIGTWHITFKFYGIH